MNSPETNNELDVSLLLTIYNQPLAEVLFSLESAIRQQGVRYEVVVADDCSTIDFTPEIEAFFKNNNFTDYVIARSERNVKTVLNLKNALEASRGRYIKFLGTGDILFAADTLKRIVEFMDESGADIGFGKFASFDISSDGYSCAWFNAPADFNLYTKNAQKTNQQLLRHQLSRADWIPSGAQFHQRDLCYRLLEKLSDDFHVLYVEDFVATLALADDAIKIVSSDIPVIWYERSGGISMGGKRSSVLRMYRDHANFYRGIGRMRPYGNSFLVPRVLFAGKHFIAHTPLYGFFQRRVAGAYTQTDEKAGKLQPNAFFHVCREMHDLHHGSGK